LIYQQLSIRKDYETKHQTQNLRPWDDDISGEKDQNRALRT